MSLEIGDAILEIGHGNGAHVPDLFAKSGEISYCGLEISSLMHEEAKKLNQALLPKTSFHLYDGKEIPAGIGPFTKIFSVNTLYFIENPKQFLMEVSERASKEAELYLSIVDKSFMEKRPFQKHGFRLYGREEIEELIADSPFAIRKICKGEEMIETNMGEKLDRAYLIIEAIKKES